MSARRSRCKPPVLEPEDPVGDCLEPGVVRDDDRGPVGLGDEIAQDLHHLDAVARVEVGGRLVGEQQRGPVRERSRDRDALLLAAGPRR